MPFLWLITPNSRPEGLASLLEGKGMALIEPISGMAAPLRQVVEARTAPEADVTISEATESDLEELYSLISSRWDVPDRDREAAYAVYENFRFGREGARAILDRPGRRTGRGQVPAEFRRGHGRHPRGRDQAGGARARHCPGAHRRGVVFGGR